MTGQFTIGNETADLVANRAVFSKTSSPPQAGRKYTVVIPGGDDSAAAPGGDGYGTATVDAAGNIIFTGVLGDGTKISQKTFMAKDGSWPFFAAPYGKTGLMIAWLSFDMNDADNPPTGEFSWTRLPSSAAKFYPLGFYSETGAAASLYTFSPGTPLFTWSDGQIIMQGGNLSQPVTNTFSIDANNKVTSSDGLKLTFTSASGTFKGTFINPNTGKPVPISGAVLENQDAGFGVFLGTDQTGSVMIMRQ